MNATCPDKSGDKDNLKISEYPFNQCYLCSFCYQCSERLCNLVPKYIGVQANIIQIKTPTWIIRDFSCTFDKKYKKCKT